MERGLLDENEIGFTISAMRSGIRYGLYAALGIAVLSVFVAYREPIYTVARNPEAVRAWLIGLGPWGPAGLIALFALQILIAPIPGYVFQVIAGYLFGWAWGTVYATAGMLIGGALAMTLARAYGRPLVRKAVGTERLERWATVTHLNSLGLWFLLMLGPLGDMLFFLAGLTTLPVWKIMTVAVLVRAPALTVSAAVGSGQLDWRSPWVIGGFIVLMSIGVVGVRYQDRIEQWVARYAAARPASGRRQADLDL
jgi:uncharacterized membrane protein YdjX (TVP38/TMEM64 family)